MLHLLDVLIILFYLGGMIAAGIAARGRQRDVEDYFTAGHGFSRLLGPVLIGLSIAATYFSGISFIVYPSVIYSHGLAILVGTAMLPVSWFIVVRWFLPRYLSAGVTEPYELVERRFGYPARATAAGMFILLRVAWMGTLIYAPTRAIIAAMQLPSHWFWIIVLVIGLSSTIYTTLGGIRGVIVTDAIQMLIIMLGIAWPVAHVLTHLPVSPGNALQFLHDTGKTNWLNTSLSSTEPFTIWSLVLGMLTAHLGMYLADQMSLQRYLASESLRAARNAFTVNLIGVVIVVLLLALLGLAMAVWYGLMPGRTPPANPDDVFPFFAVSELPRGAPGLILAALLAATMSSITSGVNALAASITLDFASRTDRLRSAHARLAFSRITSLLVGLMATLSAGVVSKIGTLFEITQSITGVFLGPLLACVVLSVTSVRVSPLSVVAGMILGSICGWIVVGSGAYILWVAPTAAAVSFAIPFLSLALRRSRVASVEHERVSV